MKHSARLFRFVSTSAILTSLLGIAPQVAHATQNVLVLTDNSPSGGVNGASHVSDLIAAFTNAGAAITVNTAELTNGSAMPLSLVTGKDVVIVVTVSGTQMDAGDVPVLQTAVNTHASGAFMFFTDACDGCTRGSATQALSIVNAAGGWSATLGAADNSGYLANLAGAYYAPFAGFPSITGTAYSPMLNVPYANVIYATNAPSSPGPLAVVVPGTANSACVFMATDVTPFWVTGGISSTQANGLAAAYLSAAAGCPLQPSPTYSLVVTTVGGGSVTIAPNQPSYVPGTTVQLTASTPPFGWHFQGWSGDASGSANSIIVTMNSNKTITATFTPISTFVLNLTTAGGGTVTKAPDQPAYNAGTVVQLNATPAYGWYLQGWSGDASGSANPLNVTMNSDKNITATFASAPSYVLNVTLVGSGSVTKAPNLPSYYLGTVVQLTAHASAGGQFVGWSGDASGSVNPLNVAMNSDKNITATFTIGGWSLSHELLFQDTFAGDGTLTGTARADVAKNNATITILPADSLAAVSTQALATDPAVGGAAAYLYAAVWPLSQPGKSGAALTDTPTRFPYVGSRNIDGVIWSCIRMDSCRVNGLAVPNHYCVDMNDNVFTPGDTILYFLSAKDNAGITTYYSRRDAGEGADFATTDLSEAAASPMEFTILPAGGWRRGGDILYVDGTDGHGDQQYFDGALQVLGLNGMVDRYDVLAPESASGNRLASRVFNVSVQLNCYRKIIWDTGDLTVTLGDGSGAPEVTDDYAVLGQFLNNLQSPGGVYLCGDDVAESLDAYAGPGAVAFRTFYMPFALTTGDHRSSPTFFTLFPKIVHWPGRCFIDDFVASGAPQIHDFDVIGAWGTSQVEMSYNTASNVKGAVLSNMNGNARVIMSGFSFAVIRDDELNGISDRAQHLHDIITWLGNIIGPPTGTGPVFRNELSQVYPNPFNPQTTIGFSVKDRGLVSLKVYNVTGQMVRTLVNESLAAGPHKNVWDGRDDGGRPVSSGVYFCKLVANGFSQTEKMVLLK
jgi:uncharacterized repeat protein (TIGR02543 family)